MIRELVRKGFLEKAPDDFTEKVMQAVSKEELSVDRGYSPWQMAAVIIMSLALLSGLLYYILPGYLTGMAETFSLLITRMVSPFRNVVEGFGNIDLLSSLQGPVPWIILAVVALLSLERILVIRRNFTGLLA